MMRETEGSFGVGGLNIVVGLLAEETALTKKEK